MRLPESDESLPKSDAAPKAGPSSIGLDGPRVTNGHVNGNGFTHHTTNGLSPTGEALTNGKQKRKPTIEEVVLPGTSLYSDDPSIDREQFVRLMLQSLRDVGYQCVTISPCGLLPFLSQHAARLPRPSKPNQVIPWRFPKWLPFADTSWKQIGH